MDDASRSAFRSAAAVCAGGLALLTILSAARFSDAATRATVDAKNRCENSTQCLRVTNRGAGSAIAGTSATGVGIVGTTNNPTSKDGYGTNGITGVDGATDGGQANIGVQGISLTSNGVEGVTNNPSATTPFGRAAVFGIDASTDGGQRNWGTAGYSKNGTGILGLSLAPPQTVGGPFTPALLAVCANGGPSIEAADGPSASSTLFLLADCSGNLTIAGELTTGSPPLIVTKRSAGSAVGAYAPRETESTIEDFGRGQLVGGKAQVGLSRDFAAVIARDAGYLVFVTPEGDSRGLYIAHRANDAFDVRELQGGHSTISFAYRIVARPLDGSHGRLPAIGSTRVRSPKRAGRHAQDAQDLVHQIGAMR